MKIIDKKLFKNLDWFSLALILLLALSSCVFIANSMANDITGEEAGLMEILKKADLSFFWLQLAWIIAGLAVMFVVTVIDYNVYAEFSRLIYLVTVVLLVLLLVLDVAARGVAGWLNIGDRQFQPAELCKIALIIVTAKIAAEASERDGFLRRFTDIGKMIAMTGVPLVLVCLQPDFGTAFTYVIILFFVIFAARIKYKYILIGVLVIVVLLPLIYNFALNDTLKKRVDVFLNPPTTEQSDDTYQLDQAQVAMGSAQLTGKGLFQAGTYTQLKYIPDRHTDFIFAVIVEALGFVGGLAVILVYLLLAVRMLMIASRARDKFGTFIVVGVFAMFAFHVFENIGMQVGLLPITGIPLPFLSYGGSSMLINMIAFGMVLNVSMRRKQKR